MNIVEQHQRLIEMAQRIPGPTDTITITEGSHVLKWSERHFSFDKPEFDEALHHVQDWYDGGFVVCPKLKRWDGEIIDGVAFVAAIPGEMSGLHDEDDEPLDTIFIWATTRSPKSPKRRNLEEETRAAVHIIGQWVAKTMSQSDSHRSTRVIGGWMNKTCAKRIRTRPKMTFCSDVPPLVIPPPEV